MLALGLTQLLENHSAPRRLLGHFVLQKALESPALAFRDVHVAIESVVVTYMGSET